MEKISSIIPSIEDLISLTLPTIAKISPDGNKIAYITMNANWNKNLYEHECFIYDCLSSQTNRLTHNCIITSIEWFGNQSLLILKAPIEEKEVKQQVWLYENLTGDGWQLTDLKSGVESFKPFKNGLIFLGNNPEKEEKKKRTTQYGNFVHFEHEESSSALYYTDIEKMRQYYSDVKKECDTDTANKIIKPIIEISRLLNHPLKIIDFHVSPRNDAIFFNCRPYDDLVYYLDISCYRLEFNPDKTLELFIENSKEKQKHQEQNTEEEKEDVSYYGRLTKIALPKSSEIIAVSPEGNKILISMRERDTMFYTIADTWILDVKQNKELLSNEKIHNKLIKLTETVDRETWGWKWTDAGIYFAHFEHTKSKLKKITEKKEITEIDIKNLVLNEVFDVSNTGRICTCAPSNDKFNEVYVSKTISSGREAEFDQITSFSSKINGWKTGTVETIKWKSKDGVEIEGILRKPDNYDPKKKYPLVFVVHGGPTGVCSEILLDWNDMFYYPSIQFINEDILVLKPNYRGSIGRGQEFMELNKDNLGIGDMWDIESAIDYLDELSIIDTLRIGCMGWSQGGYISAFLSMHSKRFKAVSIGAGIGDWYTYHISNDIPLFTTHYLSSSPFRNRDNYVKTSPITKIKEAKTPALIQHGAKDERVPISNAKEIYRGLQEMGVPVELYIFPEMGHPITKPRENLLIMEQNLKWFNHYLLGDELNLNFD